jgi:hypothetical protein
VSLQIDLFKKARIHFRKAKKAKKQNTEQHG